MQQFEILSNLKWRLEMSEEDVRYLREYHGDKIGSGNNRTESEILKFKVTESKRGLFRNKYLYEVEITCRGEGFDDRVIINASSKYHVDDAVEFALKLWKNKFGDEDDYDDNDSYEDEDSEDEDEDR